MLVHLGLFYALTLGKYIHLYAFICIFCEVSCTRLYDIKYSYLIRKILNGSIWPIEGTLSGSDSEDNKGARSKDELISDVLLWTPTHGCASVGRPARTYIQQLCEDTGCNPEDLPEAMSDREKWRETVRDIRADGATWWWWWWCILYQSSLSEASVAGVVECPGQDTHFGVGWGSPYPSTGDTVGEL